eukprot:401936-Pleurochrysis_carterae.AAC.1
MDASPTFLKFAMRTEYGDVVASRIRSRILSATHNARHPVLTADAIKFVTVFRAQVGQRSRSDRTRAARSSLHSSAGIPLTNSSSGRRRLAFNELLRSMASIDSSFSLLRPLGTSSRLSVARVHNLPPFL